MHRRTSRNGISRQGSPAYSFLSSSLECRILRGPVLAVAMILCASCGPEPSQSDGGADALELDIDLRSTVVDAGALVDLRVFSGAGDASSSKTDAGKAEDGGGCDWCSFADDGRCRSYGQEPGYCGPPGGDCINSCIGFVTCVHDLKTPYYCAERCLGGCPGCCINGICYNGDADDKCGMKGMGETACVACVHPGTHCIGQKCM